MSGHTPAPWTVDARDQGQDGGGHRSTLVMILAGDMRIATMFSAQDREANARLIAAAPELLEALKDITERFIQAAVLAGTDRGVTNELRTDRVRAEPATDLRVWM